MTVTLRVQRSFACVTHGGPRGTLESHMGYPWGDPGGPTGPGKKLLPCPPIASVFGSRFVSSTRSMKLPKGAQKLSMGTTKGFNEESNLPTPQLGSSPPSVKGLTCVVQLPKPWNPSGDEASSSAAGTSQPWL